jgi:hypothetical protein
MSNEFAVRHITTLRKANNNYQTPPNKASYNLNQENEGGPVVGQIDVPTTGVDLDLSGLSFPGVWEGWNLDASNEVELCIHDGSVAHPFACLPPGGKVQSGLFPRTLGQERTATGTGTTATVNTVRAFANNSTCKIVLYVFER